MSFKSRLSQISIRILQTVHWVFSILLEKLFLMHRSRRKWYPFVWMIPISVIAAILLYGSPFKNYTDTSVFSAIATLETYTFKGELAKILQIPVYVSRNRVRLENSANICENDVIEIFDGDISVAREHQMGHIQFDDGALLENAKAYLSDYKCPETWKEILNEAYDSNFCFYPGQSASFEYPSIAPIGYFMAGWGGSSNCPLSDIEDMIPGEMEFQIKISPSPTTWAINFLSIYLLLVLLFGAYITIRDRK